MMKMFFGCTLIAASLFLNGCGDDKEATIEYVSIPAGSFVSSISDTTVNIEAFQLAKTPTTVAQFKACVDDDSCAPQKNNDYIENGTNYKLCNYGRGDDWLKHPMNCISWEAAQQFCEWIGGRLPTADEWEYAATHDGTQALQTIYPWGNNEPIHCAHASYTIEESTTPHCQGTTAEIENIGTAAVGTYSPLGDSPLGLQDMAGNIREWLSTPGVFVSEFNSDESKVITGGSFNNSAELLTVSEYYAWSLSAKDPILGFRCAK